MADPQSNAHNGPLADDVDGQDLDAIPEQFQRPFSLYEALPYTPFTSILPFDSDVLPIPSIGSASPAPSLVDLISTQEFDTWNREARSGGAPTKRCQQAAHQVQRLLERDKITEFKFKTGPKPGSVSRNNQPSLASHLSPISKMVYDSTALHFKYPTPGTPTAPTPGEPEPSVFHSTPVVQTPQPMPTAELPRPSTTAEPKNKKAHAKNTARLEISLPTQSEMDRAASLVSSSANRTIDSLPTPSASRVTSATHPQQPAQPAPIVGRTSLADIGTPVTPSQPSPRVSHGSGPQRAAIAIELSAPKFDRSEFLVVPDGPDEPEALSARKRKREGLGDDGAYGQGLDLHQRAEVARNELNNFLNSLFQAETRAINTGSGNDNIIFTDERKTTLSPGAQEQAQKLLRKATSLNCFQKIPLDSLLRLLRLCSAALEQGETIEPSFQQLAHQLAPLQTALRAGRTALRVMCGGREDRKLYSENTIDQCVKLFKRVADDIVIKVAETRHTEKTAALFQTLASQKQNLTDLIKDCQNLFSVMSELLSRKDASEEVTAELETIAPRLIFMETAPSEKDSVLETQKFDGLRLVSMDILSQIFLLYPAQRTGIFEEIVTQFQKLPVGKRARTFKLMDGHSIQPVSALLMRLIQTSAGKVDRRRIKRSQLTPSIEDEGEQKVVHSNGSAAHSSIQNEEDATSTYETPIQEVGNLSRPLVQEAMKNADTVLSYLIQKAQDKSKRGEDTHRSLLDLFVEDFSLCLNNPDWPSAELLLRLLTLRMFGTMNDQKASVDSKKMALEILGVVATSILKLRSYVRRTVPVLDAREPDSLGAHLTELANLALEVKARPEQVLGWVGPYRVTVEYLQTRLSDDPHLTSAISYMVSNWGFGVSECNPANLDHQDLSKLGDLAHRLREMINDPKWLSREFSFNEIQDNEARLAYAITLLKSDRHDRTPRLCDYTPHIMNYLLASTSSEHPTVRSKGLKCMEQVVETDPLIIGGDSHILRSVSECVQDDSALVRESALSFIEKCVLARPELVTAMIEQIVGRIGDAGTGVRRRAMKLARDIYLRNSDKTVRLAIASRLLPRINDHDDGIKHLGKQIIEEIWFTPFHGGENSAASKTSLQDHISMMVQTVKTCDKQGGNNLDKVLHVLLGPGSKNSQALQEVCRKFVATMFDMVARADSADSSGPSGCDALQVLIIFAKADPSLITFEQLTIIKPDILSLGTATPTPKSRSVIGIYRRVVPQLSTVHREFLEEVQKSLIRAAPKVQTSLMDDLTACVWSARPMISISDQPTRLVISCLKGVRALAPKLQKPDEDKDVRRFERYALMVGMFAKNGQFEDREFRQLFEQDKDIGPLFKRREPVTVANVMVDVFLPYCSPKNVREVRKAALEAVGSICQSSPRNYVSSDVCFTFTEVFKSRDAELQSVVLQSFKEFLFTEEKRSEEDPSTGADTKNKKDKKRELAVIGGTSYDDVASATTQRFIQDIIRIATTSEDNHAFLAVEVLASINRQGLVHPKITSVAFITLTTSSKQPISGLVYMEQKSLHTKHEAIVEREYAAALKAAFKYQRDIVKDPRGATLKPFTSKFHLLMEVLKPSPTKSRIKFHEKFCAQIDFEDLAKLDMAEEVPTPVQYAQFLMENLAFFDYYTVAEVHAIVSSMEKLVMSRGAAVAQAIESDLFALRVSALDSVQQPNADGEAETKPAEPPIDRNRLRRLAAGAMILLGVWEARTYIRKLYGMGTNRREQKVKMLSKESNKPPVKVQTVTGDRFWEEITRIMESLSSRDSMMQICREFASLVNEDKEHLVQNDDEDEIGQGPSTPNGDEDGEPDEPSAGRGRKRKSHDTPGGRKKRARSSSQPRKRGRPPGRQKADADADGDFDDWA